ncbi:hypothetical protein SAMN05660479_03325 [Microbulbifer thermotolerans]|uniref:hypothetical protein n=1 Tax=Microbulbifer thermotolerans TaxID=252514 RepID=UPI0008EDEA67|nr:hypothetical protein [Microbulbifer thermotolerans]SFD15991.1 hypothetical protein SAMN05660479_03325 [Microbulbifer thermotolerans]
MVQKKNLSNPFSTGGGGVHFEAHVQASFVALMLTGGHAPCLPCWPIAEIKLQGKIDGFDTDDLVVIVENVNTKERRKLLGQVKHSISITQGSSLFGEVMQAAWNDFNNSKVFSRGKDIIALITGPLSATDTHNVQWLLNQARHTQDVDEFFRNVQQSNFSPPESAKKLEAIHHHLKIANNGNDVSRGEFYDFLNHFHLLGYDLGNEFGVVLSLLHSHISQFQHQAPQQVWSRVVDIVQTWNQDAGTITPDKLPEDLLDAFKQKVVAEMPEEFKATQEKPKTDWSQHPDATYLALAVLIGSWNEKSECDLDAITQLFGISYDEWLNKAREILHHADSPLYLKNGIWKVINRAELWILLGSRILDQDLERFKSLAVSVLKEPDPAFELPAEERYAASIYGKVLSCSHVLRKGIAEGLAILGSQPESCANCSQGKAEATCVWVIRELLTDADWVLWGSLNGLLPTLAEAAPDEFLDAIEKALRMTPSPFDELFSQEGSGITGGNYLTGLLWALEGLAWDEQYMVRVCVLLAELASHDPGGQWANRPSNSLATILLPWLPQTLASVDKRKVAVRTILQEWPEIAWDLIIQLLPGQHQTSFGSHKPSWRKTIPDNWEKGVAQQEYWQQASFYAELAVAAAGQDTARLSVLIDHFDSLPEPAFDQLLKALSSQPILEFPEEQRLSIWDHLTKFTNKHRRFADAKWALPDEMITRIEHVAEQLAPTNPFNLYQHLFTDRDFDLYEENGDRMEQREKLNIRREEAIAEIFRQDGADGVIRFAESVSSPYQVGLALGVVDDDTFERLLLPNFLDLPENKHKALVSGFIWKRYHLKGWKSFDNLDKSDWTPEQVGQFLAYLPFTEEAWNRASEWLQEQESEYWTRTDANAYMADGDLTNAIEKLIEHGRPHAAINCLAWMRHDKQPIDTNQCVRALLAALSSHEPSYAMDGHHIVELIKFLQEEPSINQDDLFRVEWAYLPLLERDRGATPQLLESRLANDPKFFYEIIRLIYRSKKEDQPPREPTEESETIATNALRLLDEWKTPPGTQQDGAFSEEHFTNWLQRVKEACTESGHLEDALFNIGKVLIHTPPDPDGLWIRRAVAAALNDREADDMQDGYRTGTYKSRGFHWVDPTAKPERELAEKFRSKAEEVENAGFQRFAVTLRGLADSYDREAERIIDEHKYRDGD